MPATTTDYARCKIYSLAHEKHGHILVKYTTSPSMEECLANHKKRSKSSPSNLYKWINANGGWESIEIHELETYPCSCNEEAHSRISLWIDKLQPITQLIHETYKNDNYQNGKIYKFINTDGDVVYVGSTKNSLEKRMSMHKYNYNHVEGMQQNLYRWLRENGGFESITIELVEKYPCATKQELEARERYWIEQLKPITNHIIPTRTKQEYKQLPESKEKDKEYREKNHKTILEKQKEYRETNKESVAQCKKNWYEQNKEKVKERMRQNYEANKEAKMEYQRQYSSQNKDKIAEQKKLYQAAHAEEIRQKQKEKRARMDPEQVRAYNLAYREKQKQERAFCELCQVDTMKAIFHKHLKSKRHIANAEKAQIHESAI